MESRFAAAVALVAALLVTSADPLPTGGTRSARGPPNGARSPDVLGEYEARLLTMLGLKERPRAASKSNLRAPAVMEHLYRAHLAADHQGRDGDSNRRPADDRWRRGVPVASDELRRASNTIRALHHIESDDDDESWSRDKDERLTRLRFDVTSIPADEHLKASHLLIHRSSSASSSSKINLYRSDRDDDVTDLVLLESRTAADQDEEEEGAAKWELFDVSQAVRRWRADPSSGSGKKKTSFVVGVTSSGSGHVRTRRDLEESGSDEEWHHRRPILLSYTHDGRAGGSLGRRVKRDLPDEEEEEEEMEQEVPEEVEKKKKESSSRRKRKRSAGASSSASSSKKSGRKRGRRRERSCKRNSLYVSFESVGWNDWIVAPTGYDAYYCQGACNFPLSRFMNATNHAVVQTLVNDVDKAAAPKTCCVPTRLGEISMLYLDRSQIVLKTYPEMVAQECGCR